MNANKYRKKPVVIEALQWNGETAVDVKLALGLSPTLMIGDAPEAERGTYLNILTLEGPLKVSRDDYIIVGVAGEVYPCKPDIFHATYDEVEAQGEGA